MKLQSAWIILLSLVTLTSNAQIKLIYTSSGDAIEKGIKASDDEKYSSAIRHFKKVHEGDTNYHLARYEMVNTYILDKQYENAIGIAIKELKAKPETSNLLYTALGNAYDLTDRPEVAISTYEKGIERFPMYYGLYYNRAVTYIGMEKWDKAVLDLQKSLKLNPFHEKSHLELGKIAEAEGAMAQAMMCYNIYLMLKPSGNLEFLTAYNDFLNSEYEGEPKNIELSTDDFSEIDELISNRIALNNKYKIETKLSLPYAKQNHLLLNQLLERDVSTGFWDVYYVPFYVKLMNDKQFSNFIYYTLQSVSNESIIKVLNKNINAIKAFPNWAGPNLQTTHSDYEETFLGAKKRVHYYWHNINAVSGRGEVKDLEPYGEFEYYYSTGNISAHGVFDTEGDGERNGKWTYYHKNGVKSGVEIFEDGDLTGIDSNYWDNGLIKSHTVHADGQANGSSTSYQKNGVIENKAIFKDGKLEGPAKYYYNLGVLHHDVVFKEGKITGKFLEYHPNQQIREEVSFVDNKRDGVSLKYYDNGNKYKEENYVEGFKNGPYKTYYIDGTLKQEGEYKEGTIINTEKSYNPNGTLASEGIYDENGKQNGIYKQYDLSGKLNLVLNYKKGELIGYEVYHKNGDLIKEAKKKSGEFVYENYYSDGTLKTTGVYKTGTEGKSGEWKYYDQNGALSTIEQYENGALDGRIKKYYSNGKLYSETIYKEGKREGLYIRYYTSGKKSQQGYYVNDKSEGLWVFYEKNGVISSKNFFVNGELRGPQKHYTVDGKLDIVEYYENGINTGFDLFDTTGVAYQLIPISGDSHKIEIKSLTGQVIRKYHKKANITHGPSTTFYGDGNEAKTGAYFNGYQHGEWVSKYQNGNIKSKGAYHYGDKNGKWEYFHENGQLESTEIRHFGNLHGEKIWYHENGKLDLKKIYAHGKDHGQAFYYDGNGVLQYIREYYHGKVVGYSYPGPDGKPVETIPIKNETVDSKSYFANGKISREFSMVNGAFEGVYKEYYENGQLSNKSNYTLNQRQGLVIEYYENGNTKSEIPYKDDEVNGIAKFYYNDGTLMKSAQYLSDVLHGEMKFYDKLGNLTKTTVYYDGIILSK